jgi:MFS family permease
VALAAGEQVTMQLDGSGLISFAVDEATAAAHAGVENTGEIIANGGRVLMTAGLAFPTLLLGFAYTTTLAMAYAVLFATGLAMITFNALSNGVLQLLVEEKYRGRLMAFYSLVFVGLSQAVGSFALGALARVITAPHAIACSAVVLILASLYALKYSDFWRRV